MAHAAPNGAKNGCGVTRGYKHDVPDGTFQTRSEKFDSEYLERHDAEMKRAKYMTKHQVAKSKGVNSYLHGFDDEHIYLILEGEQYCHPNSLGGGDKNVLPEEFWDELDKIAVKLARKYMTKR